MRGLESIRGCDGKDCEIRAVRCGDKDWSFLLMDGGGMEAEMLYQDESPRWLSDSALESGARSVRWDFDLKILEDLF